jgi:NADPH2:quinone reductase
MRAIRVHEFGEPEVMKLEDLPDPTPGPGQVVLRVKAVGVNPVDTYIRAGKYGPRDFPFTPGADCAGVVDRIGDGVVQWKPGDRAYTAATLSGAYAELALCDAGKIFALPADVGFAQGAALGVPATTAYRALFDRGQARPGETVLIHGATGGVGLFCVQLARAHGCTVVGTGGSDEGRQLLRREGAHHALDHTKPDYLDELTTLTGGRGANLIIEMLANVNLDRDLAALAKRGRVVVVGNRGRIEIDPRQAMARDADVRGMTIMNLTDPELVAIQRALGAALEAKIVRPIIDVEMPLADAPRAHREVLEGNSRGKVILVP